jgi:protein-disulfide isomerase
VKRLISTFGLSLALSACAAFPAQNGNVSQSGAILSASGAVSSHEESQTIEAGSGAITQRLLSGGLIEVGASDAPVSLVIFTNTTCDYCRQFSKEHLPRLMNEYVRSGNLRIIISPFALAKYPQSERSALLHLCAAKQHKGMAMHDLLMSEAIDTIGYRNGLSTLAIDQAALQACIDSTESRATISAQQTSAEALGVKLIPAYMINDKMRTGLPYYPDLRGQIEEELN